MTTTDVVILMVIVLFVSVLFAVYAILNEDDYDDDEFLN